MKQDKTGPKKQEDKAKDEKEDKIKTKPWHEPIDKQEKKPKKAEQYPLFDDGEKSGIVKKLAIALGVAVIIFLLVMVLTA